LGFGDSEPYHQFIWSASIINDSSENEEIIRALLAQIEYLRTEIARVQIQINAILGSGGQSSCQRIENNLYYGMKNNDEVRCLQQFLKSQGTAIYAEGQITGNFFSLTQQAVIRFQEKYASEILAPLGLKEGTGFVGSATRAKINQLLSLSS
jgi:peptidoglycan hydrolase-like protein with peptidoglycan-binding domain